MALYFVHSKNLLKTPHQSSGAGVRASIFNRCNHATVRTREVPLVHGCARVAHCVTARWRNFSHYCRPLRHYDVWLRVLITQKHWQPRRQHTVYRNKRLEFAAEQVGKLRYVTAVDGGVKRYPSVAWFAHPWPREFKMIATQSNLTDEPSRAGYLTALKVTHSYITTTLPHAEDSFRASEVSIG